MSTHGCIAKPDGDSWKGRYHHFDGYPSGLGTHLIQLGAKHGPEALIAKFIDDPMAYMGWSTINVDDPMGEPCWTDNRDRERTPAGPLSYIARGEKPENPVDGDWVTPTPGGWDAEWVYVLTPRGILVCDGSYGEKPYKPLALVEYGDEAGMRAIEDDYEALVNA